MEQFQQEDKLLQQLFQKQLEKENKYIPSFSTVFGKAEKKHLTMKKIKWAIIAVIITLVSAVGFSKFMNEKPADMENIEIIRADLGFYETLMKDGKVIVHDIYFDYDNANIRPSSMPILEEIAAIMKKHTDIKLSIEGHTDSDGSSSYNMALSEARARAVKMTLMQLSVEGSRLNSHGFGEDQPMASNKTEEGKAKNRRVEFVKK